MGTIEMASDDHRLTGTGNATGLLGDLQSHGIELDHVVPADPTFLLMTEDLLEVNPAERDEAAVGLAWDARELVIVSRQEQVLEVTVGRLQGADVLALEFRDQASLEGAIDAFAAPAGLR